MGKDPIIDGIDEGVLNRAAERDKAVRKALRAKFSGESLTWNEIAVVIESLPADARERPAMFSVGRDGAYTVVAINSYGVALTEILPF